MASGKDGDEAASLADALAALSVDESTASSMKPSAPRKKQQEKVHTPPLVGDEQTHAATELAPPTGASDGDIGTGIVYDRTMELHVGPRCAYT